MIFHFRFMSYTKPLKFVIGHTVMKKAINTEMYFYSPQGEDTDFLSDIHQCLV